MSLFSRLAEKSWEGPSADAVDPASYRPPAAKVGVIVYFGVIAVLFGLISSAYVMRMGMPGMGHGPIGDWHPMPEPPLLWVNSFVLLLSSLAWEAARSGIRQGRADLMRRSMLAAGLLGILFLAGQLLLWRQFVQAGYYASSNPANAFFYLITALHGLHIAGGLFFWVRAVLQLRAGKDIQLPVELCAVYWHFLLLVWALMMALLIST
ncbi:MAG TPA: cytochrome c oxidase subunit 3 [Sphingomicrobium sp.]|nr:cytochrome c oxidase subunit 3 [Sphingomicrobium sp.]